MSYLRGTEINEIANDVRLLSIEEIDYLLYNEITKSCRPKWRKLHLQKVLHFFPKRSCKKQFAEKTEKLISKLSGATLGIYLVHVMFVQAFSDRFMMSTDYRYPVASVLIAALIFVCGYIVTNIVKKIPFVGKWIV